MNKEENNKNQDFTLKVNDRRRFTEEGELKEAETASPRQNPPQEETTGFSLPAEFSTLILSLAASAEMALGYSPDSQTQETSINLVQAKHAIDLIGVLEEKTKGNLTNEETQLLQTLLYDLRMRFTHVNSQIRTSAGNSVSN